MNFLHTRLLKCQGITILYTGLEKLMVTKNGVDQACLRTEYSKSVGMGYDECFPTIDNVRKPHFQSTRKAD